MGIDTFKSPEVYDFGTYEYTLDMMGVRKKTPPMCQSQKSFSFIHGKKRRQKISKSMQVIVAEHNNRRIISVLRDFLAKRKWRRRRRSPQHRA